MKCFNCQKTFPGNGILISVDGDFVCGEKCKSEYERKKEHFLSTVVPSDALMDRWWTGEDFPS